MTEFTLTVENCQKVPERTERYGTVYALKNTANDKIYIGQTTTQLSTRLEGHKQRAGKRVGNKLYDAMIEIGKDKFYIEPLETMIPASKLPERERYYIELLGTNKNGYNTTNGGDTQGYHLVVDTNKMVEMFRDGIQQKDIAEYFGVHTETVRRILHAIGVYRHGIRDITPQDLQKYIESGLTGLEIANIYGVCQATIIRARRKFNLTNKAIFGTTHPTINGKRM